MAKRLSIAPLIGYSIAIALIGVDSKTQFDTDKTTNCSPIQICAGVELETFDTNVPSVLQPPTERTVADQGHLAGLIPQSYYVMLNFENSVNYTGEVQIKLIAVRDTNLVMLNAKKHSPTLNFTSVSIVHHCNNALLAAAGTCITRIGYVTEAETMVIKLNSALRQGENYTLSVKSFRSTISKDNQFGAEGLFASGRGGFFSAISTKFQMRQARSVFPCMDHPALKARFDLCLKYPPHCEAWANTQPVGGDSGRADDNDQQTTCFETTPPISTYMLSFALTRRYEKITNSRLTLLVPEVRRQQLEWMLPFASKVLHRMTAMVNRSLPITPLQLLVLYPAPRIGLENFGLLSFHGSVMENRRNARTAQSLLQHELIHQWVGNMMTIKHWQELCLQEGLTGYLDWVLLDEFRIRNITESARLAAERIRYESYDGPLTRSYGEDITNELCSFRPPLYFHMLTSGNDKRVMERFVKELIAAYSYKNAGIDDWDRILTEVSDNESEFLRGYLKNWFDMSGPVVLIIRAVNTTLTITQVLTDRITKSRQIMISYCLNSMHNRKQLWFNLESYEIPLPEGFLWYLLDDDSTTVTRKIYDRKNYLTVFTGLTDGYVNGSVSFDLDDYRGKTFVEDFCDALLNNTLPLSDDFDETEWRKIFLLASRYPTIEFTCSCCVKKYEYRPEECEPHGSFCDSLSLVKSLRYQNHSDE